ncbi:MAG: pilus assembly PilX N-terminal domain-containing protein [bacterium]
MSKINKFHSIKRLINTREGFALIPAILITSLLLGIGIFFLTSTISESRISEGYSISQDAYYLAESGIEYAIWKLKNDTSWETNFETDPSWTQSYTGGSLLFPNGSYDIMIENYDFAKADIISTSTILIGDRTSQRVIKTKIFKAIGGSAIDNSALFADRDIIISASNVNVDEGSIFSNGDILAENSSIINVADKVQAFNEITVISSASINASEIHASDWNPPAPEQIAMPAVDFDSSDPSSFKSLAIAQGQYYTKPEFRSILDNNPNLVLNGVVYVTGNVDIENGHNLTMNGVLVTNGRIDIGDNKPHSEPCPVDSAIFSIGHNPSQPSGIFTKNNITFKECVNSVNISGIIYANNTIDLNNRYCSSFIINGSMLARDISIFVISNGVTINFNEDVVVDTLGGGGFSPVITVEYWEEEY